MFLKFILLKYLLQNMVDGNDVSIKGIVRGPNQRKKKGKQLSCKVYQTVIPEIHKMAIEKSIYTT